jgi:hypothetical protein
VQDGPAAPLDAGVGHEGDAATPLDAAADQDAGSTPSLDADADQEADSALPPDAGATAAATCGKNLAGESVGVNGPVTAISVARDGTVYLGGGFTQAGPATGGGVPFDPASGEPQSAFPKVAGEVRAVVADGAGGWYIGGKFTNVGGVPRKNLAHIASGGTVDLGWSADADDLVRALALDGDTLYVGGKFTTLGTASRSSLGAVDIHGNVTSWNPGSERINPLENVAGWIWALLVHRGMLYVGGYFTGIAGQPRTNLASFNLDGSLSSWDPVASQIYELSLDPGTLLVEGGTVNVLASDGTTLYVGGSFETMFGIPHMAIASFDADGNLLPWDPGFVGLNSIVEAMAVTADVLYVGGYFLGTGQSPRTHLAAFDKSGALTDWNPDIGPYPTPWDHTQHVFALSVVGDTIYVGGKFELVSNESRVDLAAVDTSGNLLPWNPFADGPVYAMANQGDTLYVGGRLRTMCGQTRRNLAALDATGKLTGWNPDADGSVSALAVDDDVVYLGGGFSTVGGQPRRGLAAARTDGSVTSWNPTLSQSGYALALAVSGNTIYVGGTFNTVGGQVRNDLAAVDASGAVLPWNPKLDGTLDVHTLAVMGGLVYVGGFGSGPANYLAAFAADGSRSTSSPDSDGWVYSLATDGTTLYVGGDFTALAGETRNRLAAFDASGHVLPWNPDINPGEYADVAGVSIAGSTIYVSGSFTKIAGQPRKNLAAIGSDGTLLPWNHSSNLEAQAIAATDTAIYVGGQFNVIDSKFAGEFARLDP